ncbi:Engulfment/cell motility, ELMO domain-containing protein [Rozella allomycis CSF55]|uniref:Engulfment/cell motility, ELMO domain-containing protein n=1 Tax=Rozella allomycis (strain CSF55) TaxID=988480 RepID=A0A075B399_ROZAC|nr:Engulfment/cell motility, ELMO domain-containing protein [Rozella allomycis CSF55]|eukprot:EPZ37025.1 Engulfment/cell motility, ELMO domain-containing protein [Rozella allomycis CSF55]
MKKINDTANTKFQSGNAEHEEMLKLLWDIHFSEEYQRIGSHWKSLGFQGKDPATDFRGMGLLGLSQLIFFGNEYPDESNEILQKSQGMYDTTWYYAIERFEVVFLPA